MAAGRKRTVELEFTVDDSDVKRGVANVDKNTASISSKLSKAGTAIKIGFAAAAASGVATGIKSLADLAVAAEGIERRFQTVFGNTSDSMSNWIDEQNEAFGVSEVALKGMAAGIQDLLVPMGFARGEAASMTQEILETANALSEWTGGAVSTEQAIDAVAKAMLGEREQLKGLGVAIKEADVKAELARMGLDGSTGAALEQAKAQATLNLILGKSKDALDAYAEGADSAARSQKELTARYEDAKQALADRFLPIWQDSVVEIDEGTKSLEGFGKMVAQGFFRNLGFDVDFLGDELDDTGRKTEITAEALAFANTQTDSWMRTLEQGMPTFKAAADTSERLAAAFSAQASALAAINGPLSAYGGLLEKILGPEGQAAVDALLRLSAQQGNPLFAGTTEFVPPGAVTTPAGTRNIQEELDRRIRQVAQ